MIIGHCCVFRSIKKGEDKDEDLLPFGSSRVPYPWLEFTFACSFSELLSGGQFHKLMVSHHVSTDAWLDVRALQLLRAVWHLEDLQALRCPEKVGTPVNTFNKRSRKRNGKAGFHHCRSRPLTCWNRSTSLLATRTTQNCWRCTGAPSRNVRSENTRK